MQGKIFNVIILDKSGSMSSISRQAVDGVNETLGSIRSSSQSKPEVEQLVTIVAFCGCETKEIRATQPISEVSNIDYEEYSPCCMTPLYDAIGNTIGKVRKQMENEHNATASVTIITDGYENSSREFDATAITQLIDKCKAEGWLFAYIGADHDVKSVAFSLNIDHHLQFDKSESGLRKMFNKYHRSRSQWSNSVSDVLCCEMPEGEKEQKLHKTNKKFF